MRHWSYGYFIRAALFYALGAISDRCSALWEVLAVFVGFFCLRSRAQLIRSVGIEAPHSTVQSWWLRTPQD